MRTKMRTKAKRFDPVPVQVLVATALLLGILVAAIPVQAAPQVGAAAPDFSGRTTGGETVSLSDFHGRTVVLEWTNHGCPFVQAHYDAGNMQDTQRFARDHGAVWLTIISSAPGKQGYVSAAEADRLTQTRAAAPHHVILDPTGEIGRLYGATRTPHMFVIEADGSVAYMGAIDDQPRPWRGDISKANNYVKTALTSLAAGEPIADAATAAYGCTVKYGS